MKAHGGCLRGRGGTCPAGCFSVLSADGRKIGKIIVFVSVGNGF